MPSPTKRPPLPRTSTARLQIAQAPAASVDANPNLSQKTVLYLAYGSNQSVETFRGTRGIEPISQVNVYVPELRLTFDLAGIPYSEPCFSGTHYRGSGITDTPGELCDDDETDGKDLGEKGSLLDLESGPLDGQEHYHKDRWHKPLVGVVYEVTLKDYAYIIATEGAGSGYKDIIVSCFPFSKDYNPNDPTPDVPDTKPFMAHTLLSPSKLEYGKKSHRIRPDPSYAQPSARYIKLLRDGANELDFPHDYHAYLASIRPYTVTTFRQSLGQKLFLTIWLPLFMLWFAVAKLFANDKGIVPGWVAKIQGAFHEGMWRSYDIFYRKLFGDGERTIGN